MALRAITPYIPTAEAGGFTARFGKVQNRGLAIPVLCELLLVLAYLIDR